ncbi:MAG: hypothetical protein LBL44_11950, partial [Treponema sp.]|nr:hypothetical protein [Treponema sp.]
TREALEKFRNTTQTVLETLEEAGNLANPFPSADDAAGNIPAGTSAAPVPVTQAAPQSSPNAPQEAGGIAYSYSREVTVKKPPMTLP